MADPQGKTLAGAQFSLLSAQDIRNASCVEVTQSTMLLRGQPRHGGPIDTRFGTTSRFYTCGTCRNPIQTCPGHPGHHEFPYPVPHVAFIALLARLCNCFCFNCSAYLLPRDALDDTVATPRARVWKASDMARRLRNLKRTPLMCPSCGLPQPLVVIDEPFFKLVWRDDVVSEFFHVQHTSEATAANAPATATTAAAAAEAPHARRARPRAPTAAQLRARAKADAEHQHLLDQLDAMATRLAALEAADDTDDADDASAEARRLRRDMARARAKAAKLAPRCTPAQPHAPPAGETPAQTVARCEAQLAAAADDAQRAAAEQTLAEARAALATAEADEVRRAQLRAEYEELVQRPFNNWDAYFMLRAIAPDDLEHLGFNTRATHPASMLLRNFLVPAIGVRPSVAYEEGSSRGGFDKLTREIGDVIKASNHVRTEAANSKVDLRPEASGQLGVLPEVLRETIMRMYHAVSEYMCKGKCKVPTLRVSTYTARAKANAPCVTDKISTKDGIVRQNLMGKRINYCLRTVVTTGADLDMDQVGVPREMAKILTVPERVTLARREELEALMAAGHVRQVVDERTGAMTAITEHNRDKVLLLPGMVVERHLRDGDYMPTNRQPTLHMPSIMAHRVVLHDDRTLKIHPGVTIPYNADHDGDEMNGHIPQLLAARAEAQEIMHVPRHVMHPRADKPVVGLIQDHVAAAYFLTHPDTFLTRADMCQLAMCVRYDREAPNELRMGDPRTHVRQPRLPPPAIRKPQCLWTGKQALSLVLPRISLTMKLRNRPGQEESDDWDVAPDGLLRIRNGELLQGSLCKQTVGDTPGGIIHCAAIYRGENVATRFVSDVTRLLNNFFSRFGFSVGVGDFLSPAGLPAEVRGLLRGAEDLIARIWQAAEPLRDDPQVRDAAEDQTRGVLKALLSNVGTLVRGKLTDANRLAVMAAIAGSKGSPFNIAQIMALVGQTFVNGRRPTAVSDKLRQLPCEPLPHQPAPPLREQLGNHGLVANSFMSGLTLREAFMHAKGGREGLVDTANKSVTGDTVILIKRAGAPCVESVEIGPWIDGLFADPAARVERHPEHNGMEVVHLDPPVRIPTAQSDGRVLWADVTHATRHDPTPLYHVRTEAAREVVVAASQSLLVWRDNHVPDQPPWASGRYVPVDSRLVRVGDALPCLHTCARQTGLGHWSRDSVRGAVKPAFQAARVDGAPLWCDRDRVASIRRLSTTEAAAYPKLYDLTVPATLNFALANGLVVRDTAITGYMQRQMMKAAESHHIEEDLTVRGAHRRVYQMYFGGDGLSPKHMVRVTLNALLLDDQALRDELVAQHLYALEQPAHQAALTHELRVVHSLRDRCRQARRTHAACNLKQNLDVYLPFDAAALVLEARLQCTDARCRNHRYPWTDPADVLRAANRLREVCELLDAEMPALFSLMHLHETVGTGALARRWRCCPACLDRVLERALCMHRKARLPPGDGVGPMAATSVGEPTTQVGPVPLMLQPGLTHAFAPCVYR